MAVSAEVDIANLALSRLGQPLITTLTEASRDAIICNELYAQNRDYCLMLADWDCLINRQYLSRTGAVEIAGATAADPVVVTTSETHTFVANELITIEDVVGMTQLNGGRFKVYDVTSVTITLYDTNGTSLDGSGYTAWVSGGIVYLEAGGNWSYVYDIPSDCLRVLSMLDSEFGEDESYLWVHERGHIYTDEGDAGVRYIKKDTDPSHYDSDLVELIATRLSWMIAMRIHSDKELRNACYQEFTAIQARAKLTNAKGSMDGGESAERWTDAR